MIISSNKYENIFSAPIAGYTNWPLRQIFNDYKAYLIFSEMVHVREILYGKVEEIPLIKESFKFAIQLFGSFEDDFITAGKIALQYCDNIDINCGCPVRKVIKAKGGVFWLSDIDNFSKKIGDISYFFPNIVSVKIRLGFDKIELSEILQSIKKFPISFITIHMRTGSMLFSGRALYQYANLITGYPIPIILNGDIDSPEFAKDILDKFNCNGIMIGRAAIKDPLIFSQINDYIKTNNYKKTDSKDRINNCIKYIDYLIYYVENYGEKTGSYRDFERKSIIESRKILFSLSKKINNINQLKEDILKIKTIDDLKKLKEEFINFKI